jgi:exodeoxyribonuclease-3
MRIATWNINGMRARLDLLLHWLRARAPDVVGLQELKMTDEQFPHDALATLGYRAVIYGQKAWNGVAVLVREPTPVQVVQAGLPGQDELGARFLTVDVAGLAFTTVYCPNGKSTDHADFPRKLAWLDVLIEHCGCHLGPNAVICGDFNVCPAAIDSWAEDLLAGRIFHTEAERSRMQKLLGCGLVDLFRAKYPDTQAYTWWDYRGGAFHKRQGLRIDLLLGTPSVASRVRNVEIDREYRKKVEGLTPADHAPVLADLD